MKMRFHSFRKLAFGLATVVLLSGMVAGCRGCDVRPIPISIPFGQNLQLGAGINGLPAGRVTDFEVPLGTPGQCLLNDLNQIVDEVQASLPSGLSSLVAVDRLLLEELRFEASSGSFSFLEEVELEITTDGTGGTQTHLLRAVPSGVSGNTLVVAPVNTFDLWALIEGGVDCVTATMTLTGEVPQQPVVFTGSLEMTLFVVLRP